MQIHPELADRFSAHMQQAFERPKRGEFHHLGQAEKYGRRYAQTRWSRRQASIDGFADIFLISVEYPQGGFSISQTGHSI
jgi:hypothetical protein